jgi:putative protein-disulfide isomerase
MTELYYVHDPMCSWCWGFQPALNALCQSMPAGVQLQRLVGGLAPDSDEPMPDIMRENLQKTWQRIEQHIPGTQFNFAFWTDCAPRRSTYPACRAVIAAREQGGKFDHLMTCGIQRAYYLEARNPSDKATLVAVAAEIGLDAEMFARSLDSLRVDQQMKEEIRRSRMLGINSFPSLMLLTEGIPRPIQLNYVDSAPMLEQIAAEAGN